MKIEPTVSGVLAILLALVALATAIQVEVDPRILRQQVVLPPGVDNECLRAGLINDLSGTFYLTIPLPPEWGENANLVGYTTLNNDGTFFFTDTTDFGYAPAPAFKNTVQHGIWVRTGPCTTWARMWGFNFDVESGKMVAIVRNTATTRFGPDGTATGTAAKEELLDCPTPETCPDPFTAPECEGAAREGCWHVVGITPPFTLRRFNPPPEIQPWR